MFSASSITRFPGRFTALDGWRGLCALLVAVYHFRTGSHIEHWALVRNAYLFVDFFFVLSGFVVTYAYIDRIRTLDDTARMIWRRLGRLWPLHVAVLLAFILIELATPGLAWLTGAKRSAGAAFDPASSALLSAIPTNVLLLHGLGVHDRLTWNFPSWSISTEVWTYLLFAILVLLTRARTLLASLALVAIAAWVVTSHSDRGIAVDYDLGLFRCIAGFFTGHLVFRLMRAHPARAPRRPLLREAAALAAVAAFVMFAGRTPLEFAAPLVFGAVVWVFALEQGAVSRVLKATPFTRLGLWSYSIYMVHSLLISLVHRAATVAEQALGVPLTHWEHVGEASVRIVSFGGAWAMDALVALYLVAVIGLARLAWTWIEMPAQRWWNRPGRRDRTAPPAGRRAALKSAEPVAAQPATST
jgi:peptidoglycan/LPS O-acetylase OafA/YrhL